MRSYQQRYNPAFLTKEQIRESFSVHKNTLHKLLKFVSEEALDKPRKHSNPRVCSIEATTAATPDSRRMEPINGRDSASSASSRLARTRRQPRIERSLANRRLAEEALIPAT